MILLHKEIKTTSLKFFFIYTGSEHIIYECPFIANCNAEFKTVFYFRLYCLLGQIKIIAKYESFTVKR